MKNQFACEYRISEDVTAMRLQNIGRMLGLVVVFIGLSSLLFWKFNSGFLGNILLILPPTNPMTAVGLVFSGFAIFFLTFASTKKISLMFSLLIIIIGIIKIFDTLGVNLPIDQIFFKGELGSFNPPSRMAPSAAVNFILAGLALLFIDKSFKGRYIAQYFSFLVIIISLLLSIGYLFGTKILPQLRIETYNEFIFLSPLAPFTAYGFLIIGIAILLMRAQYGFIKALVSGSEMGSLTRRLVSVSLVAPIMVGYIGVFLIKENYLDVQFGAAVAVFLGILFLELFIFQNSRELAGVYLDRCEAEEKINQAKAFDDALLFATGEAVVSVDKEGLVTYLNKAAEDILGLRAKESIGRPYTTLWSVYDKDGKPLPIDKRPINISLKTGEKLNYTLNSHYSYVTLNKIIPVNIAVAPIIVYNQLMGVIASFRDISVEAGIDKAKSEFISLAAHQLRTPATAIGWMIETFLKKHGKKIDADQYRSLEEIYQADKLIKDIIEDFLNVSRIELDTSKINLNPIEVSSIIKKLIGEEFKAQINENKTIIKEKYEKEIIINTDENLLKIAINNLISNAIKYTTEGGIVSVELKRVKAGDEVGGKEIKNDGYLISVSDDGYGIPQAQQGQIFSKLFRADNVREKDIEGTGLGLYMVKSFINKLGGEVWFESKENKGSQFFIYLK